MILKTKNKKDLHIKVKKNKIKRDIFKSFAESVREQYKYVDSNEVSLIMKQRFYSRIYKYYSVKRRYYGKEAKLAVEFLAAGIKSAISAVAPQDVVNFIGSFIPGGFILGLVGGSILSFLIKEKVLENKQYEEYKKKLSGFLKQYSCEEYKNVDEFSEKITQELLGKPKSPLSSLVSAIEGLVKKAIGGVKDAYDYVVDKSEKIVNNIKDKTKEALTGIKNIFRIGSKSKNKDSDSES